MRTVPEEFTEWWMEMTGKKRRSEMTKRDDFE
jgi:hypothetical protein